MEKLFYFDVETTGLDATKNDIIQLALIVELDGQVAEEKNFKIRPFDITSVEDTALKVNGVTRDELETYPQPEEVFTNLYNLLGTYIDPYNRWDKFIPIGYNVQFDMGFLKSFFLKNECKFFGSYFQYKYLDPYTFIYAMDHLFKFGLKDHKLITVAKYFGFEHDAHDALSDIKVTRRLWKEVCIPAIKDPRIK